MAKWNKLVITNAGLQLSAKTLSGQQITYTHAQTTSKDMSTLTTDQLREITKLDSIEQDVPIGTVSVQDDHTVNVPVKIVNTDVTTDYLLYGVALFAKAATDQNEILYGILTAVNPDPIPAYGGSTAYGSSIVLKVHIGNADNVQIIVTPDASVSNQELDAKLKDYITESEFSEQLKTSLPTTIMKTDAVETVTAQKKFNVDPVNAKGDPYITAKQADLSTVVAKDDAESWQKQKITDDAGMPLINITSAKGDFKSQLLKINPGLYTVFIDQGVSGVPITAVPDDQIVQPVGINVRSKQFGPLTFSGVVHKYTDGSLSGTLLASAMLVQEQSLDGLQWNPVMYVTWAKPVALFSGGEAVNSNNDNFDNGPGFRMEFLPDDGNMLHRDPNTSVVKERADFKPGQLSVGGNVMMPWVMCPDRATALAKSAADPNTVYCWPATGGA